MSGVATGVDRFCPINLEGLVPDTVLAFDLFVESGPGTYLLWHRAGGEFTAAQRTRLVGRGVSRLWVAAADERLYEAYVERHLSELLDRQQVATSKASLFYSAAHTTLAAVMSDPRHQDAVPRTRDLAREMVSLLIGDPNALAQLSALMARDYDTVRHCINVSLFATALAHATGTCTSGELQELAHGTLLHDIGKSAVPRDLIIKPGAYTPQELALMRTHVTEGEQILRAEGRLGAMGMLAVSQHHERLDGGGYPRGLSGHRVHFFGRVTGIADVYDALTSERSYKHALGGFDALRLMRTTMAAHLDQELLRTFVRTLAPRDAAKSSALATVA